MTPQSLFNIILKILGILFIKEIFIFLPQLVWLIPQANGNGSGYDRSNDIIQSVIVVILTIIVIGPIIYFLIFKTEYLINKLKLYKGFNQEFIPLNMHRSSILSISIIVIGGLILVNELPHLFEQLFNYIEEKSLWKGAKVPGVSYIFLEASKVFVGLLLIIYQKHIVNFIEYKQRNKANELDLL
jgi:hypothetical protein